MNRQILYRVSKYDYILAAFILVLSVGSLIAFKNTGSGTEKKALIYKNNELINEASLSREEIINFDEMEIKIKDGRVRALSSDCPQKICVHTGWISSTAQTIVCVPNKVLIEIVGVSPDAKYDVVSY